MNKHKSFWMVLFLNFVLICFSQEKSNIIEKTQDKEYYVHKVKKGESLYGISKLYGVSTDVILQENPDVKESGLKAGKNIFIPVYSSKKENEVLLDTLNYKYHKVMKGQTIFSICKEYNITQENFFKWNPEKNTQPLKENEYVIVGKKEKVIKKNEVNISDIKDNVSNISQNIQQVFEKKRHYQCALLLPFGAQQAENIIVEDLVKNQQSFPAMSSMMIDFLKGLEYAADSLKTDSFSVKLLPIDINENDSLKLLQVLKTKEYQSSDIVFGSVFSSLIKLQQNYSTEKKFTIVPFVSQNKFLFNHPEYSKTTPSIYVDIQALAQFVYDSLRPNKKVVLIQTNNNNEKEYAKEFKRYYNDLMTKHQLKDTISTFKSIYEFKNFCKEKNEYVVVLLTNNQIIATEYITQLNIIHKTSPITLCGLYKTTTFDNLDLEYLNLMKYTFAYYQNLNTKNLFTNQVKRYKEEFYSEPSMFFFEGLQIGLYYFNTLKTRGLQGLLQLDEIKYSNLSSFMKFEFYHPDNSSGFQNNGEFVYQIIERKPVIKK